MWAYNEKLVSCEPAKWEVIPTEGLGIESSLSGGCLADPNKKIVPVSQ